MAHTHGAGDVSMPTIRSRILKLARDRDDDALAPSVSMPTIRSRILKRRKVHLPAWAGKGLNANDPFEDTETVPDSQ